jgi:hypothetical protein
MYSDRDHPKGWGFPIRISPDQSLLAAPRGFSQPATSFIASMHQGIHRTPLLCLIEPVRLTQGLEPEDPIHHVRRTIRTQPHSTQRDQSGPMPEDIEPDEKPDQPRLNPQGHPQVLAHPQPREPTRSFASHHRFTPQTNTHAAIKTRRHALSGLNTAKLLTSP